MTDWRESVADKEISGENKPAEREGTDEDFMWRIIKITGVFIFLLLCSVQDIREKEISVKMLILSGSLFWTASLLFEEMSARERICNILPGLAAFLLAFLTREQIGYGDAACLVVLGSVISAGVLLGAVFGGLVLLSACSVILLAGKKADRKTTLPFVPCLSAGMALQIIMNTV